MDLFNKTFFKFAFGFIGIILLSVAVIIIVNTLGERRAGKTATICLTDCAK